MGAALCGAELGVNTMYYLQSINGLNQSNAKSTKSARMLAQKMANKTGSTVWVLFGLNEESAKRVASAFPATEYN